MRPHTDVQPNWAKCEFGREPRCSLGKCFLSVGEGVHKRNTAAILFLFWEETLKIVQPTGQRSTDKTTALSFSKAKTQTQHRWRLVFHLSGARIFPTALHQLNYKYSCYSSYYSVITGCSMCREIFFLSSGTVNHLWAELMREWWELNWDQQTVQSDIWRIHHKLGVVWELHICPTQFVLQLHFKQTETWLFTVSFI